MRGELPAKGKTLAAPHQAAECQTSQVLMSKCVDQELKPEETFALKEHLRECEACQTQLKQWKEHSALMSKALNAVWKHDPTRAWSVLPRTNKK
jgi:anti-sigma factor RsiW